jgi:hypothetical protein
LDNFMVRYFAGVQFEGSRGVTHADLLRAMCNLRRIDVVMIMEEDMNNFNASLGWRLSKRGGTHHNSQNLLAGLPAETLALLEAKTRYDTLLYRFAADLAEGERQADWQDRASQAWHNRTWRLSGRSDRPGLGLLEAAACDKSDRSWTRCSEACVC